LGFNDPLKKRMRWNEGWKTFYPEGDEYFLIEFTPFQIEVMSISNEVYKWIFQPEIIVRKGT
jgi:hypothetical protein